MTTPTTKPVTSDDIYAALRLRYPLPEYVFLAEVANGTGWGANRWADALVMGVWPSRGLELTGLEIKVSRSDWTRERKRPDKAESIALYCDRWFVVAPPGVVPPDQVPPSWGLMELRGTKLVTVVEPRVPLTPKPVDRPFLASLLRCAVQQAVLPGKEALDQAERKGYEAGKETAKRDVELATGKTADLARQIAEFERVSGVQINNWTAGQVGAAVRCLVQRGGIGAVASVMNRLGQQASALAANVEAARVELNVQAAEPFE